ncbi:MAG: DMT family transporter [Thermanaeromonas sp.]|uniref:DMT family transporter n=1 Tax=Thermanaeromonas sp. TaxID=2003697 RepID=UPI00243F7469|nr:DMT family transporter [Thermanaeromonas sp.]MCG0278364.1 DMT family transporter [Thermanaeromonas sp.]
MGRTVIPALALLTVAFVWGATFYFVREALKDIGPFHFLFYRFLLASLFLLALSLKERPFRTRKTIAHGFTAGLILFGGYAFQTLGLKFTSASKAAFITGLSVVIVPLGEALLTKKSPPVPVLFSTGLAATGLGLLSLEGSFTLSPGDWLVLLCAFCFAGHVLFIDRVTHLHSSSKLALVQLLTVGLLSVPFLPLEVSPVIWSARVAEALLLTAILATSVAFIIQLKVQRYLSAAATAVILATEPVFGALIAYTLGGEILTAKQLLGCAFIFVSMLFIQTAAKKF